MKKPLKILLIILLIPIILFLIFFITSFIGNPLTRIQASSKIEEYASKEFNNLEYTLDSLNYDPKFNLYYRKVDIPDSEDKDFFISYKNGEIFDERESATNGINISNRIQPILNELKYEEPLNRLFQDNLHFCLLTLNNDLWQEVTPDITIEDFLKIYPLELSIYLYEDIDNEEDIKKEIIQEYEKLGIQLNNIIIE